MSEGCEPLISGQDASPRYRLGCVVNRSELPRERFSPLALFGHGAMSNLGPLSGVKRKLDFEAVRSVDDPSETLATPQS